MFLKKKDASFHGLNTSKSVVCDHFNITEVSHYFHKSVLFGLSFRSLRKVFNTISHLIDEISNVTNFLHGVIEEVLSVFLNPSSNSLMESVN